MSVLDLPEDADYQQVIFNALGAASACWQHIDRAGTFDSARCKAIGEELVERLADAEKIRQSVADRIAAERAATIAEVAAHLDKLADEHEREWHSDCDTHMAFRAAAESVRAMGTERPC